MDYEEHQSVNLAESRLGCSVGGRYTQLLRSAVFDIDAGHEARRVMDATPAASDCRP